MSAGKLVVGMTDLKKIGHDFIYITISCVLLGSQSTGLVLWIFNTSLDIMGGASASLFQAVGVGVESTGYDGMTHLVATCAEAVAKVIQVAAAIASAGSVYNLANYFYAGIIIIPWFVLSVAYAAQVIVAVFRLMVYGACSSLCTMFYAFGWGRGIAGKAGNGLVGSIVVMLGCTCALTLVVYGVTHFIQVDPTKLAEGELNEFASFSNGDFLLILGLGLIGSALMTEGTSVVNSFMGTMFTNAAAGIITAGTTAVAAMAAKKANPLTLGSRYADAVGNIGKNVGGYAAMGSHAVSAAKGIGQGASAMLSRPAAAQEFLNKYRGGGS